jgi:hypothetical protein
MSIRRSVAGILWTHLGVVNAIPTRDGTFFYGSNERQQSTIYVL